jgi:hypothetical protein
MIPLTDLRADCGACSGLCCVATGFARSADFAIDKPAGTPCPNLAEDFGCSIHETLRPRGFPGCTTFDCFGAGQQVTGHTFGGRTWRSHPELAGQVFTVFGVVRALHELLWYLTEAVALETSGPLRPELEAVRAATEQLTREDAEVLQAVDVDARRADAVPLLRRAGELARAAGGRPQGAPDLPRDLVGRDLRRTDLAGADLRGALLIGADLRGVRMDWTDLTGADLRGADVRGAALSQALFLTQFQVNAALGDSLTTLPEALDRPSHWTTPVDPGLPRG